MSVEVRSIHLPTTAALDALRERAIVALDSWAREWVTEWEIKSDSMAALRVQTASDTRQRDGHPYEKVRADTGGMWFRCGRGDRASLGRAVMGAELMPGAASPDEWIDDVIERAWDERNRSLCSALLGAPVTDGLRTFESTLPVHLFALGSGAVELSCEALGLHALADNAVWRSIPPVERTEAHRRTKLAPLDQAVRHSKARLEVTLGSVELELPALLDLRPGDVLRLPQRLDQGLAVMCEGKPFARAALAEQHGRKCVQVTGAYR